MIWRFGFGPLRNTEDGDGAELGGLTHEEHDEASEEAVGDKSDKDKGDKDDDDELSLSPKDLKKQLAELRKKNAELQQSERYWADRAKGVRASKAEDKDDDEEDGGDDEEEDESDRADLIEAIAKGGVKALRQRGFITEADALRMIDGRIQTAQQRMANDARLTAAYPDLNNEKSELFQHTKAILQDLADSNPEAKRNPAAFLAMAVRTAKAEIKAKGERDDDEVDRRRRVRAQAPERSSRSIELDDDDTGGTQIGSLMDAMRIRGKDRDVVKTQIAANRKRA